MKVYVAAKFEEKELAKSMMDAVEEAGFTITHDWTAEAEPDAMPEDEAREYLIDCARKDMSGVCRADVLIVAPHIRGKGLFVEMGMALALGIPIIVINSLPASWCIFQEMPQVIHVQNIENAMNRINYIARKNTVGR
jgi:nucleoside 2-deoxyribosyltransferase